MITDEVREAGAVGRSRREKGRREKGERRRQDLIGH
jgi:hypothetical protein